jgi:hypothetical protein
MNKSWRSWCQVFQKFWNILQTTTTISLWKLIIKACQVVLYTVLQNSWHLILKNERQNEAKWEKKKQIFLSITSSSGSQYTVDYKLPYSLGNLLITQPEDEKPGTCYRKF